MSKYLDCVAKSISLVSEPLCHEYSLLSSKRRMIEEKVTTLFDSDIQEDGKCKYCKSLWIPGINVSVQVKYGEQKKRIRTKQRKLKQEEESSVKKKDEFLKSRARKVDMTRFLVYQCMDCQKSTRVYGLIQRNKMTSLPRGQSVNTRKIVDELSSKNKTSNINADQKDVSKNSINAKKKVASTSLDKKPVMSSKVTKPINNKFNKKNKNKKQSLLFKKVEPKKESLSLFDFMNQE